MENENLKKATCGQIIEWVNTKYNVTLRGVVLAVNENSVSVEILNYHNEPQYQEYYRNLFIEDRTVVNHKRYKILTAVSRNI